MLKIETYEEYGVAWPLNLSQQNKNINLEKEYFNFQEQSQEYFGKKISLKPNLLSSVFDKLAFDEEILKHVKKVIGDDIYIWSSAFFFKGPSDGKIVSFHQDNPYWQLTSDNVVTAWIALTDSNKTCGALEVVPTSHKHGLIQSLDVENARQSYLSGEKTTPAEDLLSYSQNLDEFMQKNPPVTLKLEAGQFSLHHVNTAHGSGKNNSKNNRIGFAVRYISSDTKHEHESKDSGIYVCGKENSYFANEERPKIDFGTEEIKTYELAMNSAGAFGNKKY
jgi:ectoine hydroxylase-related dioxygenase (phytanoyl-CoA dioxygenase family)